MGFFFTWKWNWNWNWKWQYYNTTGIIINEVIRMMKEANNNFKIIIPYKGTKGKTYRLKGRNIFKIKM